MGPRAAVSVAKDSPYLLSLKLVCGAVSVYLNKFRFLYIWINRYKQSSHGWNLFVPLFPFRYSENPHFLTSIHLSVHLLWGKEETLAITNVSLIKDCTSLGLVQEFFLLMKQEGRGSSLSIKKFMFGIMGQKPCGMVTAVSRGPGLRGKLSWIKPFIFFKS